MIGPEQRKAIYTLHNEGMGIRELARRLHLSRNAVRTVIELKGEVPITSREDKIEIDPEILRELSAKCDGRKQRVLEKLIEEKQIDISYSTLTRLMRHHGIGGAPRKERCDRVPDVPGAEMQQDTSPYRVKLGGVLQKVVASTLYLRYSKRRYAKFYRVFDRFAMKCFFHEALTFWGYAAPLCIIDNTNLARLRGTGEKAVMVPEMVAFADQYGFKFRCHEKRHCNRKAGEERGFYTVESNFFPGREFENLEDMNRQAYEWATVRLYHRPVGKAKVIPAKAFEHEEAFLIKLPPHLPAPYKVCERGTDQYGFASVDGNYYWVPGSSREGVQVLQYSDRLQIYRGRELLAEYTLPADGVKNDRISPPGFPKPRHHPHNRRKPTLLEETRLRAMSDGVGAYLDFALAPKGIERHHFVRELFALAQQMTAPLFTNAIERALRYRITSVETIRRIALLSVHHGSEALPSAEVDQRFQQRDAYREGHLTDSPDFSSYEDLLEDHHG
jgi:hypothetical protein